MIEAMSFTCIPLSGRIVFCDILDLWGCKECLVLNFLVDLRLDKKRFCSMWLTAGNSSLGTGAKINHNPRELQHQQAPIKSQYLLTDKSSSKSHGRI